MSKVKLKPPFETFGICPAGGLGELFKCRDANGVQFAAKFPKDRTYSAERMVLDESRRVERHQGDHVVAYYGPIRHQDGRMGYAMELMDGSLYDVVATGGALAPSRAIDFLRDAAKGLASVHGSAAGAFHGDVKLANILFKGSKAKLADFGLARGGVGQTRMLGPHQGGTEGYFPPEGFASTAGDVYSLGVALWAMLAGREPTAGGPDLGSLVLSPLLSKLLDGMLEKDWQRRIPIEEVLRRLPAVLAEPRAAEGTDGTWLEGLFAIGAAFAGIAFIATIFGVRKKA